MITQNTEPSMKHTCLAYMTKEHTFKTSSRGLLTHHDSAAQTLTMGASADLASNPGDSTTAFPFPFPVPSPNEHECDAQHAPQDDQHNLKDKPTAPPTNPSSTAELISPSTPSRGPPAWLLLLDRHWNPLACLWVGLSLLCILVLLVAVPTEPVQPAKIGVAEVKRGYLLAGECAIADGYRQYGDGEAELLSTSLVEGDTSLPMNLTCWGASSNANRSADISQTTTEQHPQNPQTHAQAQAHAHTHAHRLPPEQLCLLLVALTVFVLPLPGYVLVGVCCWVKISLSSSSNKKKDRGRKEKKTNPRGGSSG